MKAVFTKLAMLVFSVLAAAFLWPCNVFAQDAGSSDKKWTRLSGAAVDISINSVGEAYAAGPDGAPWHWDALQQRWRRMSGNFVRITAAEGNRPWAVNADGVLFHYNGLWWENKDTGVVDVAADALGNVFAAKADGTIQKWNPLRSEWRPIEGNARRLAIDTSGQPWAVTVDGQIRAYDGKIWKTLPGHAVDIAINGDDAVVIADLEGQVWTWNAAESRWVVVPGVSKASNVAAAPDGGPWAVVEGGVIMATTLLVAPEQIKTEEGRARQIKAQEAHAQIENAPVAVAPNAQAAPVTAVTSTAPPADAIASTASPQKARAVVAPSVTATDGATASASGESTSAVVAPSSENTGSINPNAVSAKGPITFVNTLKTAASLAIGADGSVFGLDVDGNLLRWSNARKRFDSFPGTLVRIAVDPSGNPWGISALGRVFRHTGKLWKQIPNATASDIAISSDGIVVTADANGKLYRLNSEMTRFELIPGNGILLAVAPNGTPWTIRSDKLVQRCDALPCKVIPQKAENIAIGPDGSVWIVSDRSQLMRLKADGQNFEVVITSGHTPSKVAVGPNGYPWVVSDASIALASQYFPRDETNDSLVASATAGDTVGTGNTETVVTAQVTGFVFSKTMQFETINSDALNSGQWAHLDAGNDGKFYAYNKGGGVTTYNANQNKFVDISTKFGTDWADMSDFAVASNGDIWAYTLNPLTGLFRERDNAHTEYTVSGGTAEGPVAIAPDDTVYALFSFSGSNHTIYKKASTATSFTKFSNDVDVLDIGVGPGNDVWIVDRNNYVKQWTGSQFEKRPASGQLAGRIDVGSDGTVYIKGTDNALRKWNGANNSFDKINNTNIGYVAVDDDGRPWTSVDSTPTIKRAKD